MVGGECKKERHQYSCPSCRRAGASLHTVFWYARAICKECRRYVRECGQYERRGARDPYNTLAAQLAEKEAQLNEREAAVAAGSVNTAANNLSLGEILGASSFFISIILLILVAMNFYFDAKRGKSLTLPRKYFVDLR